MAAEEAPPPATAAGPTLGERLRETFSRPRERVGCGWLYGLGVLLIIIALLLPPVSLLQRVGLVGYTTVSAAENTVSHPDGLTLSVDPDTFDGKLRVRLDSIPRLNFLEGSEGKDWREAVEALPSNLVVKSPLYLVRTRKQPEEPVTIDIVIPNDSEPWETLDLYTWTGTEWKWVGGELHTEVAEHEFLRLTTTEIPENLVVVQAGEVTPVVAATLSPGEAVDDPTLYGEVHQLGLLLGTDGGFVGEDSLPPAQPGGPAVFPTVRNWAPDATVNHGLLADVLNIPAIQEAHIANIIRLCTEKGFAGVALDYRGVKPEEREAYADFVAKLAAALHAQDLRLTVAVEPPVPTDGGWDEGGYDLARIGAIADAVELPLPADPAAYAEGGAVQHLLDWVTARVNRYKLRVLLSSLSAEQTGTEVEYISLEEALQPFGKAVALNVNAGEPVEPGTEIEFGLFGQVRSVSPLDSAGTYRIEYGAGDENHTVWPGTPDSLAARLRWVERYHLGGAVVADLFSPGNAAGVADVVRNFLAGQTGSSSAQDLTVAWTVTGESGVMGPTTSPLTEPGYTWKAMVPEGSYVVNASIAGFDHGSVPILVGQPEPVVTTTAEVTATTEPTRSTSSVEIPAVITPTEESGVEVVGDGVVAACLDSAYVADVTVPDNTQFDNGEEFDKTWKMRNTGTCAWPDDTVLAFSSGDQMDAPDSVEVGPLAPGAEVDITVHMKAPADPGRYTGLWQLKTSDGFFGGKVSVVIQAGEVAETPIAPISNPGSFELGGHIRDGNFPYADLMHYAGMTWAKVQVRYNSDAAGIIAAAHGRGFKIQLSALGTPGMVTQPGFEQDFANWVATLAAEGADAIEVWNEPNIDREWQAGYISPQAYTNLLCAAYNAIKSQNAGTAVISAAPAPTGYFGGCSPNGCDDAPWMAGLRDAGAANCMDYIGAHHNSGATSPSARTGHPGDDGNHHHSWYFLPQTELYYNTFGGARQLFYTEMGYASQEGVPPFSDQFAWARGTNNAQQAAWLAEAVQLSINTGMVRCIIVWNIDFVRYGYDPQDGYAIVRPGGSCPACDALHNVLGTR